MDQNNIPTTNPNAYNQNDNQSNNLGRKPYVNLTLEIFEMIKRSYKVEDISRLMTLTSLSRDRIYKIIKFIEETREPTYNLFKKQKGRKKQNNLTIETKIREIIGRDMGTTQIGVADTLNREEQLNLSLSTINRRIKSCGLVRKRLTKRPSVVLNESHQRSVAIYCARLLGVRNKTILFLDESGFNLHISTNYGYAPPNEQAISYVTTNRGRNISLCGILSPNGLIAHKIVEGAFNTEIFNEFLLELVTRQVITEETILVLDNVRFHHNAALKAFFDSQRITMIYLPSYSPDFNPIENVFSYLKSKVSSFRPKATTSNQLLQNITRAIEEFNNNEPEFFLNYYRHMWEKVNNGLYD